jgi:hypothetical protein
MERLWWTSNRCFRCHRIHSSLNKARKFILLTSMTKSLQFILLAFLSLAITAHAGERVLFAFDDHSIPWRHNLKVTLVQAEKHPANPVLRRSEPWEGVGPYIFGSRLMQGGMLKNRDAFWRWATEGRLDFLEVELSGGGACPNIGRGCGRLVPACGG